MADGFDIKELENYEKKLLAIAQEKLPKESKKFLKKSAGKLSKQQKNEFKTVKIGETGEMEREVLRKFKAGKVYKREGNLQCRAYLGAVVQGSKNNQYYSYGAMLNNGYIIKNPWTGEEHMVKGFRFIEQAQNDFTNVYYEDTQNFIDELLDKGL